MIGEDFRKAVVDTRYKVLNDKTEYPLRCHRRKPDLTKAASFMSALGFFGPCIGALLIICSAFAFCENYCFRGMRLKKTQVEGSAAAQDFKDQGNPFEQHIEELEDTDDEDDPESAAAIRKYAKGDTAAQDEILARIEALKNKQRGEDLGDGANRGSQAPTQPQVVAAIPQETKAPEPAPKAQPQTVVAAGATAAASVAAATTFASKAETKTDMFNEFEEDSDFDIDAGVNNNNNNAAAKKVEEKKSEPDDDQLSI